ncbi:hypothetical protein TNCV_4991481 [Trichonephila clavipes]|nr:hypothetical protein TNCV_4991481 [Trichonephila clavipes]
MMRRLDDGQEWINNGRYQCQNGSSQPRATIELDVGLCQHGSTLTGDVQSLVTSPVSKCVPTATRPGDVQIPVLVKAVTAKCLGGQPVDRDRLNAHPGSRTYSAEEGRNWNSSDTTKLCTGYSRAIADGPRSLEPRSSDEDDISAGILLPKHPHHTRGRVLSFEEFNAHKPTARGDFRTMMIRRGCGGSEGVNINTVLFSYTRAFVVSDHVILNHGQVMWTTPGLAPPSPNYHTNGRTFQLSTDLACIAALHGGSLVVLGSNS